MISLLEYSDFFRDQIVRRSQFWGYWMLFLLRGYVWLGASIAMIGVEYKLTFSTTISTLEIIFSLLDDSCLLALYNMTKLALVYFDGAMKRSEIAYIAPKNGK